MILKIALKDSQPTCSSSKYSKITLAWPSNVPVEWREWDVLLPWWRRQREDLARRAQRQRGRARWSWSPCRAPFRSRILRVLRRDQHWCRKALYEPDRMLKREWFFRNCMSSRFAELALAWSSSLLLPPFLKTVSQNHKIAKLITWHAIREHDRRFI